MQDRIIGKCAVDPSDEWSAEEISRNGAVAVVGVSKYRNTARVMLSLEDASRLGRSLLAIAGLDVDKLEAERDELRARASLAESEGK